MAIIIARELVHDGKCNYCYANVPLYDSNLLRKHLLHTGLRLVYYFTRNKY